MPYDENSPEPLTESDTDNATIFHAAEADTRNPHYWKLLAGYNSGVYTREWADQRKLRRMDNLALFDAVASNLDLTKFQRTRGRMLFGRLDLHNLGTDTALAAFCVCVKVAKEDGRNYHPNRKPENNDELFEAFRVEYGLTKKQVRKALPKVEATLE